MASKEDDAKFVDEKNAISIESVDDLPSYEDAAVTTGAPTEKISPLGYHVDWISVIFLVCLPLRGCVLVLKASPER
jgi:hypothetical protein